MPDSGIRLNVTGSEKEWSRPLCRESYAIRQRCAGAYKWSPGSCCTSGHGVYLTPTEIPSRLFAAGNKEDTMPDVLVSNSDWQNLSEDGQSAVLNAVSQTFGFSVVPSGSGVSLSAGQSSNTVTPTGSNPNCENDCLTIRDNCLNICNTMQDPKFQSACVTACWGAYGICLLQCAA